MKRPLRINCDTTSIFGMIKYVDLLEAYCDELETKLRLAVNEILRQQGRLQEDE